MLEVVLCFFLHVLGKVVSVQFQFIVSSFKIHFWFNFIVYSFRSFYRKFQNLHLQKSFVHFYNYSQT